ncbi:MAG: hypothetical protein M0R46_16515 [Candidatus Muirbacterium halophilum]|nr:hypothetical protein [Candidatus Muirbacterium halophilum]
MKKIKTFENFTYESRLTDEDIKKVEEPITVSSGSSVVNNDSKKKYYGMNSDWNKNNLPFEFESPISKKEYQLTRGYVKSILKNNNPIYYLTLLNSGNDNTSMSIKIYDLYDHDDIAHIEEGREKKSFYIKNLQNKDVIYKIIEDIKKEIEESESFN